MLLLNLIDSCGRAHHRHGQQQLLIQRQPVHQNRQTAPPHSALIYSYSIASFSSSSDLSRSVSCPGASGLLSGPSPPSWTT